MNLQESDVKLIAQMTWLEKLELPRCARVTNKLAGLRLCGVVAGMTNLTHLNLGTRYVTPDYWKFGDVGLELISDLFRLKSLSIRKLAPDVERCEVTDEGLLALTKLKQLAKLNTVNNALDEDWQSVRGESS